MPKNLRFHPEVAAELKEAIDFGLEKWPDRVGDLLEEYEGRLNLIIDEDPSLRREMAYGVKRINLRRFPYHIIFLPSEDSVFIIAFCDSRKQPNYWKDRF